MATIGTPQSSSDQAGVLSETAPVAARRLWRFQLTEDGWAVLIGGFLIAAVLAIVYFIQGYKFQVPVYQWATASDLTGKVLTVGNLLLIAIIGVIFAIL